MLVHVALFVASLRDRLHDDTGASLVEYALLAALIGVAAAASAPLIETAIGTAYAAWNNQTQDQWRVPDPVGGGS